MYAYQPETSVVSLAVPGMIRIANEESNCILLICNSDHPFDCQAHKRSFDVMHKFVTSFVFLMHRKDFWAKI